MAHHFKNIVVEATYMQSTTTITTSFLRTKIINNTAFYVSLLSYLFDHFGSFNSLNNSVNAICNDPLSANANTHLAFSFAKILPFFSMPSAFTSSSSYLSITSPTFISSTTNIIHNIQAVKVNVHQAGQINSTLASLKGSFKFHLGRQRYCH